MKYSLLSLEQEKGFEQDGSKRYISRAGLTDEYHSMAEYATALNEYRLALDGLESTIRKEYSLTPATANKVASVFQD